MNWDQIEGQWKIVRGQARSMWGKLTDDDLESINGQREKLLGKVQERYGYEREKAEQVVDEFVAKLRK